MTMSKETDRAIGEHLAGFLDDYQERAEALARPWREAAELRRRLEIAGAFVADMPCQCRRVHGLSGTRYPGSCGDEFVECAKHYLERVLAGDE